MNLENKMLSSFFKEFIQQEESNKRQKRLTSNGGDNIAAEAAGSNSNIAFDRNKNYHRIVGTSETESISSY